MRSQLINSSYWIPYCQSIFGSAAIPDSGPAVSFYNKKYGGLDIVATNIVFANAIEDPWQFAGMRKVKNPDTT